MRTRIGSSGGGVGPLMPIGRQRTGRRGRPRKLYMDADGNVVGWQRSGAWVQATKKHMAYARQHRERSFWRKGERGMSYVIAWLWRVRPCDYCGQVRQVWRQLLCFHKPSGRNAPWVRSHKAEVRGAPESYPEWNRPPDRECQCPRLLPGMRAVFMAGGLKVSRI